MRRGIIRYFSKNRDRPLEGNIAAKFLVAVLAQLKVKKLLSSAITARSTARSSRHGPR
ncbi:hypothetical protein MPL1032_180083 [Mesorhizobium plurifarium]|uniref:Uncharacterized protein n=1 Tax=Mesorhizobium plurifarium TaxID=69974 RepID=A0A0K2VTG2_MESPL|nr:hypothetical protein MPL1032_180083 [Mesorhizobium plurifarium]